MVMGFSGDERRITQVLSDHAARARKRFPSRAALLWMNFGTKTDAPVNALGGRLNDKNGQGPLAVRHYDNAPLFLFDLLARHRLVHPAGRERYRCLPTMPWAKADDAWTPPKRNVVAFFREADWAGDEPKHEARGHADASVAMAKFCREAARGTTSFGSTANSTTRWKASSSIFSTPSDGSTRASRPS